MEKFSCDEGKYCSLMTVQGERNSFEVFLVDFNDGEINDEDICYHLNNKNKQAAAVLQDLKTSQYYPLEGIKEKVEQDGVKYDVVALFVIGSEFHINVPNSIKDVYVEKFPIKRMCGDFAPWSRGNQVFIVRNDHPYLLSTKQGSLYSKDGKKLFHYNPKDKKDKNREDLLPTVKTFAPGALLYSGLNTLSEGIEKFDCGMVYANDLPWGTIKFEGKVSELIIPSYHEKTKFYIPNYIEDVVMYITEAKEPMSMLDKNSNESMFFRAPKPDETPAIGHIVSFTQAPDRVWEGMKKNINTWRQTIKVNALAVGAIEPLMMDCAGEEKCHQGTRIYLLGSSLAGLNLAEQKALLNEMSKQDYVCTFEVYEHPEKVYQKLIDAGWQGVL